MTAGSDRHHRSASKHYPNVRRPLPVSHHAAAAQQPPQHVINIVAARPAWSTVGRGLARSRWEGLVAPRQTIARVAGCAPTHNESIPRQSVHCNLGRPHTLRCVSTAVSNAVAELSENDTTPIYAPNMRPTTYTCQACSFFYTVAFFISGAITYSVCCCVGGVA